MNCRNASQQFLLGQVVISQTYQDIGSEPTLVMEQNKAEAIGDPLIPGGGLADQTGTNFARSRLGRGGFGKANQNGQRSEGLQVTRGVGCRNGTPLCNSIP
jgi:hypothetical protein